MGLTLDELNLVLDCLTKLTYNRGKAIRLLEREIRLKELEKQIPKMDVSGNDLEE